ncbi:hypothetical protein AHAS_Ahas04G0108600 [Arachis hypogaea]
MPSSNFGLAHHAQLFKWHAPKIGIPGVPCLRAQVACPGFFKHLCSLACHVFELKWHAQPFF